MKVTIIIFMFAGLIAGYVAWMDGYQFDRIPLLLTGILFVLFAIATALLEKGKE